MLTDITGPQERYHRGFILIEVLVSITLLVVAVSGIVATLATINQIRVSIAKQTAIACSTPDCRPQTDLTQCSCGKKTWRVLP